MDKKTERRITRVIQNVLGQRLLGYGFEHTKPTFYTRLNEDCVHVIHLHKYSFGASFRMHTATRLLNDPFEAISLNGPDSHDWEIKSKRRLNFDDNPIAIENCVANMILFFNQIAVPYFKRASIDDSLGGIDIEQRHSLSAIITNRLLGLK